MKKKYKSGSRSWSGKEGESAGRLFRIMGEFAEGYEKLPKFGPCISIFGSARVAADSPYYALAQRTSELLAQAGYGIITGGGPGIMEAGNKGAKYAGGRSVGLHILLKHEKDYNGFIDEDKLLTFRYFFTRKVMFIRYAQAFVYLPGGFGTMDELFEVLTLIQTGKISRRPLILMGVEYWRGLLTWIEEEMSKRNAYIAAEDLNLIDLTDDPEEVVDMINRFYEAQELRPNF